MVSWYLQKHLARHLTGYHGMFFGWQCVVRVKEWLVWAIQVIQVKVGLYVRVKDESSEKPEVKMGVHWGSVLSPLLFIMVYGAVSKEFETGCCMQMTYYCKVWNLNGSELMQERQRSWLVTTLALANIDALVALREPTKTLYSSNSAKTGYARNVVD